MFSNIIWKLSCTCTHLEWLHAYGACKDLTHTSAFILAAYWGQLDQNWCESWIICIYTRSVLSLARGLLWGVLSGPPPDKYGNPCIRSLSQRIRPYYTRTYWYWTHRLKYIIISITILIIREYIQCEHRIDSNAFEKPIAASKQSIRVCSKQMTRHLQHTRTGATPIQIDGMFSIVRVCNCT